MKDGKKQSYTVALFFDGTGNNSTNSSLDAGKYGEITNIRRLFESCDLPDKLYVEGVGTQNNKGDSSWAKATGNNPPGYEGYAYEDKLQKGMDFLINLLDRHPDQEMILLVYGFCRGATLARDLAKRALAYAGVRIGYLGVYDTVKSLLFVKPVIHFTAYEMERVDQILHLVGIHEARKFFPLSSIRVRKDESDWIAIENYYTPKEKEIFVPGAHADVGGGYSTGPEYVYLNAFKKDINELKDDLWKTRTTVQDHFSGNLSESIWMSLLGYNVSFQTGLVRFDLVSKREKVSSDLASVYFEVMASCSNAFLTQEIFRYTSSLSVDHLKELKGDLLAYIISNTPVKGPNYVYEKTSDFTHISANYGKFSLTNGRNISLNTFDPVELINEIHFVKMAYPKENFSSFNEEMVYDAFDLSLSNVNEPNNDYWQREIVFG